MDKNTTLEELKMQVKEFCEARDWDRYHNAKELAIGASTEAAELLEPFRFQSESQVEGIMETEASREKIGDEMADVFFFLLRLSQKYDLDLSESFARKMQRNGQRYPVSEFRGKNHKSSL